MTTAVDKQPASAGLVTGRCGGLLTHSSYTTRWDTTPPNLFCRILQMISELRPEWRDVEPRDAGSSVNRPENCAVARWISKNAIFLVACGSAPALHKNGVNN